MTVAGFLERDFTWNLSSKKPSKLSRYRLKDNYLRFYLKYIEKDKANILKGTFKRLSLSSVPGIDSILAYQFETLVLNNRALIQDALTLRADDILYDNPFFQRKTAAQPGCQVDYMIQNKYGTLFVCEIKFSRSKIAKYIIPKMQEKIKRLKYPKGFRPIPVLIHINGVTDDLMDSEYFSHIIDFSVMLEKSK